MYRILENFRGTKFSKMRILNFFTNKLLRMFYCTRLLLALLYQAIISSIVSGYY